MKKMLILMSLIVHSILVNAQTINEFGITVDYEITDQNLIANFIFDGLTDEYKIHIFMDNEVDSYGSIGYVTISYRNSSGYRGTNYFMATNSIDSCCNAILDNLRNNTNRPVINSSIRNKSNEIIILIRRLLVEALQTGKMNLSQE